MIEGSLDEGRCTNPKPANIPAAVPEIKTEGTLFVLPWLQLLVQSRVNTQIKDSPIAVEADTSMYTLSASSYGSGTEKR
jgi:hypothetical protein